MSAVTRPKATFRQALEATSTDWEIIERAEAEWRRRAGPAAGLLRMLAGIEHAESLGAPVNIYTHSLQCATRALDDGADDEMIVVALFHDLPETFTAADHGFIAAQMLRPRISEARAWLLTNHAAFQDFYFANHPTRNGVARESFRGSPHFSETDYFCRCYDQNSFDPDFVHPPLERFVPIVHRYFGVG